MENWIARLVAVGTRLSVIVVVAAALIIMLLCMSTVVQQSDRTLQMLQSDIDTLSYTLREQSERIELLRDSRIALERHLQARMAEELEMLHEKTEAQIEMLRIMPPNGTIAEGHEMPPQRAAPKHGDGRLAGDIR